MAIQAPVIGNWYLDLADNQIFEVVAVDEQFRTIEIQYKGGEVSELDFESWAQFSLTTAEAPEDAGAPYELSPEDEWDNDRPMVPENWSDPIQSIEPESFPGIDDY